MYFVYRDQTVLRLYTNGAREIATGIVVKYTPDVVDEPLAREVVNAVISFGKLLYVLVKGKRGENVARIEGNQ